VAAGASALVALLILALVLPAFDAAGQSKAPKPREEQPEDYPDGPNREDTFYFCTACHGFKIVAQQAMTRTRWNDTLDLMVTRHGMPDVQGADRDRMLDYLESAFPEREQPGGWRNPFAPQ
jgi:hypothetical protein